MKSVNLVYVGNFALADPTESDRDAGRSAALVGQTADASSLQIVAVALNDGGDGVMQGDNFGAADTFSYDLGSGSVVEETEATMAGVVRIVDAAGSEHDVRVVLIQATNGDLFMSGSENHGALDNLEIASVEIRDITRDDLDGWTSNQSVEGSTIATPIFAVQAQAAAVPDGTVDGEATGETMTLGYDDSNAPTDQGGTGSPPATT